MIASAGCWQRLSSRPRPPIRLPRSLPRWIRRKTTSNDIATIGGQEAPQMIARFDADVFEEAPDLVLWQVGSNSVLMNHPTPGEVIREGVESIKASGAEVILVNPQYAPKILAKPDVGHMVDVITATARDSQVGLFNRFAIMRYWFEGE